MDKSVDKRIRNILEDNITNINLLHYFRKRPIFLGSIQKRYFEILPLIKTGLIKDFNPKRSYKFVMDKLENFFYAKYQEKIESLNWRLKKANEKRKNKKISEKAKLRKLKDKASILTEKIQQLKSAMKKDPFYQFLLFMRNNRSIIYNQRIADEEQKAKNIILTYLKKCAGKTWKKCYQFLIEEGIYHQFNPAKQYCLTEMGKTVQEKLKKERKANLEGISNQSRHEKEQEEEFKKLMEDLNF